MPHWEKMKTALLPSKTGFALTVFQPALNIGLSTAFGFQIQICAGQGTAPNRCHPLRITFALSRWSGFALTRAANIRSAFIWPITDIPSWAINYMEETKIYTWL